MIATLARAALVAFVGATTIGSTVLACKRRPPPPVRTAFVSEGRACFVFVDASLPMRCKGTPSTAGSDQVARWRDEPALTGATGVWFGARQRCVRRQAAGDLKCAGGDAIEHVIAPATGSVALAHDFACLVRPDGSVGCWGDEQTWRGPIAGRTRAWSWDVVNVPGIDDAVDIEAGWGFACVRRRAGTVSCFGQNLRGQLGRAPIEIAAAGDVPGVSNVSAIAAGGSYACALHPEGSVTCWGLNQDALKYTEAKPALPARIEGIADAVDVRVTDSLACARARDGAVRCWGKAYRFQVGTVAIDEPKRVEPLPPARSLFAGGGAMVAIDEAGTPFVWGTGAWYSSTARSDDVQRVLVRESGSY